MNILSLDLEFTQPSQKIIQIGACIGDLSSGSILDTVEIFVNPGEKLTDYIVNLTGITQQDVDNGLSLREAYEALVAFKCSYEPCQVTPLTWGGGDSLAIQNELGGRPDNWPFGYRWADVKTIYQSYRNAMNMSTQGGLANASNKMGLPFKGKKHNAKDDAINTFKLYYKFIEMWRNKT